MVLRMITGMDNPRVNTGWGSVVHWIFMTMLLLFLLWFGVADLRRTADVTATLAHLGYPPYFLYFIGTGKLLAAATFVYPRTRRLREWAYAGISIELISAFASHWFAGDALPMRVAPLVFLLIAGVAYRFDPHRM
jgi:hypothetical protein